MMSELSASRLATSSAMEASIVNPLTVSNEREIQPMDLPIEQLNNLKLQHEEEIRELQKQMESLAGARNRFIMAKNSLAELVASEDDNALMIPLNSSLYVPGNLQDKNKVVVELGTGYFCEKSIEEAQALIDRKLQLVAKSIESVESVGINKSRTLEVLTNVMNYKLSLLQK